MTTSKTVTIDDELVDDVIEAMAKAHPDKLVHAAITTLDDGMTQVSVSVLTEPLPDCELPGKLVVYHKP